MIWNTEGNVMPKSSVWIAPGAHVVGNVHMGVCSSVWYGAVVRGDEEAVWIGDCTNVQDNAVVHVSAQHPARIGNGVTIGHGAIVHGCTIGNNTLVGMGALVLDGASVGNDCVIGAGALITQHKHIPDGSMAFGSPARVIRQLSSVELAANHANAKLYVRRAQEQLLRSSASTYTPVQGPLAGLMIELVDVKLSICKLDDFSEVALLGVGRQRLSETPSTQCGSGTPGIRRVSTADIVFLAQTDTELSLVCATNRIPKNVTAREDGWIAFRIEGILDFSLKGILAEISAALAQASISIFAVSTYNTDYVLVKEVYLHSALCALQELGISIKEQG